MSTSLARQLEQLRTSSSTATKAGPISSLASSGPSILDIKSGQELTNEQLEILANEAFNQLSGNSGVTTGSIKVLEKFRSLVFKDSQPDDEDIEMKDESGITFENLLVILSPYLRQRPIQFLLQYLVNNYNIHDVYTEWLLFTSLQHYEYTLFNRIVDSLPLKRSPEESRPRWVEHFRSACHPATTIGMHRHLACDKGFFSLLCEKFIAVARNHVPIFGKEENISYNGLVGCFAKAIVGALNLVGSISEQQTHLLMQTIVAALKCDSKEFRAAGSILFSVLVPRVKLNEKAASKLLKVLAKMVDRVVNGEKGCNVETLGMVAILYRCQSSSEASVVDKTKVLDLIIKHEEVIKNCTTQFNQMEDEDKEFARRLFKMLAVLSSDMALDAKPTESLTCLLEIIVHVLNSSSTWSNEVLPTAEVAEILIETASKSLIQLKASKKKSKKQGVQKDNDVIDERIRGRSAIAFKAILDYMRDIFQDEYCAKFKVDFRNTADILFMDQPNLADSDGMDVDHASLIKGPLPEQIAVKQLLLDNDFIKEMSKEYITFKQKYINRETKNELKENANAIKVLFGKADPSFLLRQMSSTSLIPLITNCVKVYERKPKILSKIFNFTLKDEFIQNPAVQEEMRKSKINLDLIFLQHLCVINPDCKDEIVQAISDYAKYSKLEIFAQMMVTLNVARNQESNDKKFAEIVIEKLITLLTPTMVIKFLDDVMEGNKVHQEPDTVNLLLLVAAVVLGKMKKKDITKQASKTYYELTMKTVMLGLFATQEFEIKFMESLPKNEKKLFEANTLNKLMESGRNTKVIPLQTFDVMFSAISHWAGSNALCGLKQEEKTTIRTRLAALSLIYENKLSGTEKATNNAFYKLVETELCENNEAIFESFVAEILFLPQGNIDLTIWDNMLEKEKNRNVKSTKSISFEIKQRCAERLCQSLNGAQGDGTKSADRLKRLLVLNSPTMPLILASISCSYNHKKILKAIFNCFEAAIYNPASVALDTLNYLPLIKHLEANRSIILAGCGGSENGGLEGNIKDIMHIFIQNVKSANSIISGLLHFIIKLQVIEVFEPLLPFVYEARGNQELEEISNYGTTLLSGYKKDPISTSKALELLLLHFLPSIFKSDHNEICWDFLSSCVKENRVKIVHKDEIKSVSQFALEVVEVTISNMKSTSSSSSEPNNELLKKTFQLLIDLSKDKNIESQSLMAARNVIDSLMVEVSRCRGQPAFSPSIIFAEKLVALWGDKFFEPSAGSGRLARAGRSSRFTALYGKTYIRSLSNLSEEEQKWRQTLFLCENFLNYTKNLDEDQLVKSDLEGFDAILKPLNILLKVSLDMDELYDNSYTLDILLSAIHVVVDISSKKAKETNDATNPELIVQCIRTCKTPDTKATALLILAKQASCASSAEYVMHNSIPIFTFMGNHFLKIEAKSSFDVACHAIDIIIPHIQRACLEKEKENKGKQNLLRETSLSIINTFVDASSDMPPHRFKTFMSQLVRNLSSTAFQISPAEQDTNIEEKKSENYLWIVTLLLLKMDSKRRVYTGKGNETESVKLTAEEKHHQLRELYNAFDDDITFQMEAILRMLTGMKNDTPDIRKLLGIKVENDAMDIDGNSGKLTDATKQFETVRIKMMYFVSSGLLQCKPFVWKIVESLEVDVNLQNRKESDAKILQNQLRTLIEISITNMENYEQIAARKQKGNKISKVHQQLSVCCERVLEAAIAILPTFSFITLLTSLLSNNYPIVRKKSLEVFNTKLQQVSSTKSKERQSFMLDNSLGGLLKILVTIAQGKVPISQASEYEHTSLDKESCINQQMALMCLRSFARATHSMDNSMYVEELKECCQLLSKKGFLKTSLEEVGDESVVAAILLCLTEMFSCIGPHAVVMLPPYVDWVLEIMSCMSQASNPNHKNEDMPKIRIDSSVLLSGTILAIQKCMENFGGFLNPYYSRFVTSSCRLTWIYQREGFSSAEYEAKKPKMKNIDRIHHLHSSMSKGIPTHSLIDIASKCHQELSKESPHCIMALSNILKDNVSQLDKNGALAVSGPFLDYFLSAFTYRQSLRNDAETLQPLSLSSKIEVNVVENKLIDAFLALVLKLPLDDFKPMFYRLVNMAVEEGSVIDGKYVDSLITTYRITSEIAGKLKSLFGFVAENVIQKATHVLNIFSKEDFSSFQEINQLNIKKNQLNSTASTTDLVVLITAVFEAVTAIFVFNRLDDNEKSSASGGQIQLQIKAYEEHVNAILMYFDAPLHENNKNDENIDTMYDKMEECLGYLASSTDDETQWKYLNYQVLLYVRHNSYQVRLRVLQIISSFLDKKGENYLAVLPDSAPLLAEALEDDDARVEKSCRKLMKKMEEIFGHSVESYFE